MTGVQRVLFRSLMYSGEALPVFHSAPGHFDVPSRNATSSWSSTVADFLESSYRGFGIAAGLMNASTFVRFSPVAVERMIEEYVDDAVPEIAASLPLILEKHPTKLARMAVPSSVCVTEKCTEVFKYSNAVQFAVGDVQYAQSVSDMKNLLFRSSRPLLLTMPMPMTEYWIPCYDVRVQDSPSCKAEQPCPSFINAKTCGHLIVPSELSSSEFYQTKSPASPIAGPAETMIVVGYTDDHVTLVGRHKARVVKRSSGGFIVRRSGGNTMGFYEGSVSFGDNAAYCAGATNPSGWRGPLFNCMQTTGILTSCLSVKRSDRRSSRSATLLECVNESLCDKNKVYAVAQSPLNNSEHIVYEDDTGFAFTRMYEADDNVSKATLFEFQGVPYHRLGSVFRKTGAPDKGSLFPDLCNYWFLPYDVVDDMIMLSSTPLGRVHAVSMDIKWERSGFQMSNNDVKASSRYVDNRVTTNVI